MRDSKTGTRVRFTIHSFQRKSLTFKVKLCGWHGSLRQLASAEGPAPRDEAEPPVGQILPWDGRRFCIECRSDEMLISPEAPAGHMAGTGKDRDTGAKGTDDITRDGPNRRLFRRRARGSEDCSSTRPHPQPCGRHNRIADRAWGHGTQALRRASCGNQTSLLPPSGPLPTFMSAKPTGSWNIREPGRSRPGSQLLAAQRTGKSRGDRRRPNSAPSVDSAPLLYF